MLACYGAAGFDPDLSVPGAHWAESSARYRRAATERVAGLDAFHVAGVVRTHRQGDSTYRELLGDRLHVIEVSTVG